MEAAFRGKHDQLVWMLFTPEMRRLFKGWKGGLAALRAQTPEGFEFTIHDLSKSVPQVNEMPAAVLPDAFPEFRLIDGHHEIALMNPVARQATDPQNPALYSSCPR